MNEGDEVNATVRGNHELLSQDNVLLVIGSWSRGSDLSWSFEPDMAEGEKYIRLRGGMTYGELVGKVKGKLDLLASNTTIKLSYQYPLWLAIDDGDGSTPQYITDDEEVEIFVQMRRKIEEVNLCVFVVTHGNGLTSPGNSKSIPHENTEHDDIPHAVDLNDVGVETDEEWHTFAMSETPLTIPPLDIQLSSPPGAPRRCAIRNRGNGISIREPEDVIRLGITQTPSREKGKGKLMVPHLSSDSESDSDSEEERNMLVPVLTQPMRAEGEGSRSVRRQLMFDSNTGKGEDNEIEDTSDSDSDADHPSGSFIYLGRFAEALHKLLSDGSDKPALFDRDAPPVFDDNRGGAVDSALADVPYEGDNLFVGRVFKSKIDCKIKIAIHAIHRKFNFRTTRSTPSFMVLKCVSSDCPWRVYAAQLDESGNFQIRQATLDHNCSVDERRNFHRLATTQVIGQMMQCRFVGIKKGPEAAAIRKMLLDDYHVNVSYWKAWRAREIVIENSLGSMGGSYALIPAYLALLRSANVGSLCFLEQTEEPSGGRRFKYCFVALGASVIGYPYMRKVIIVDGTSLKGKYRGCLLSACAQDGNFQIFPLAFAVVDSENDDAWEWFFMRLHEFVFDSTDLVFISDRHASIRHGIQTIYPLAHHATCTVHLYRNVVAKYKPKRLGLLMSDAARCFTVRDFNRKFVEIQRLNAGCAAYLVNIGFEYWSRAHFQGKRYNIMDSNIAKSWNVVLKEAREFPIISMLEYIRTTVMSWFVIRRAKAMREKGTITPRVRLLLEANFEDSTRLAVRAISEHEFQVQERHGECFTVKLDVGQCSCMEFQQIGIPCAHALAVAGRAGKSTNSMIDCWYFVETWKNGFNGKVYPVPSVGPGEIEGGTTFDLLPPPVKRPAGKLCVSWRTYDEIPGEEL